MIKTITVIGAGTMGNGIAHVCAQSEFIVNLVDINDDQLKKALETISKNLDRMIKKDKITEDQKESILSKVFTTSDIHKAASLSDLVIEAASEKIEIKKKIFKQLDGIVPGHCILASNTSSISITDLASVTNRSDKVIGMHFMNPVPIMKLVEIISGYNTSDKTLDAIVDLTKSLGKTPIQSNDYPGFIANRILMPMINEAIYTLYEGVAGVEAIDSVMRLGMAHPMGPLQLADFIGLDICLAILRVLNDGFGNPKYAPCPLLVNMVLANKLGRKTGEGFYLYHQDGSTPTAAPSLS